MNNVVTVFIVTSFLLCMTCEVHSHIPFASTHGPISEKHAPTIAPKEFEIPVYEYEKRLTDKILGPTTQRKLSRPVKNAKDAVVVNFGIGLVQVVELSEINEVLVTRLWITMDWTDGDISWIPRNYGNLTSVRIQTNLIWTPDISLYNNAESIFHIPLVNLATIYSNGSISWTGPVLFRSSCFIDVTYFPFDRQNCSLKLGPWTHSTDQVDMLMKQTIEGFPHVGSVDMSRYWKSAEWDVQAAYGIKSSRLYRSTNEDYYSDVTYYLILKRLPLFYTVNVMIPCFEISAITVMIFILPVGSFEKVTSCVSVLVALTLFLILFIDVVPSTSHVISLLGQFLLSTTVFVTLSIAVTIVTVNIHYRGPKSHKMSRFTRILFFQILPRILWMKVPKSSVKSCQLSDVIDFQKLFQERKIPSKKNSNLDNDEWFARNIKYTLYNTSEQHCFGNVLQKLHKKFGDEKNGKKKKHFHISSYYDSHLKCNRQKEKRNLSTHESKIHSAIESLVYICERMQRHRAEEGLKDEWKFVSDVIDRIFLFLYVIVNFGFVVQLAIFRDRESISLF